MIPPRNFPESTLELVEMDGKTVVQHHAKLQATAKNRLRIQNMRNDLLMADPKLNLQIIENGCLSWDCDPAVLTLNREPRSKMNLDPETTENTQLTTKLSSDENGNLILDFPDELLQAVNWKEGDTLGIELFAGGIIFRKIGWFLPGGSHFVGVRTVSETTNWPRDRNQP